MISDFAIYLAYGVFIFCPIAIPFAIWMAIRDRRKFFEEHGRYPNSDDYLDSGLYP